MMRWILILLAAMANLPAQVQTDLSNAGLATVDFPAEGGRWQLPFSGSEMGLLLTRGGVLVRGNGCIIDASPLLRYPWIVGSTLETPATEHHATGVVTPLVNSLTCANAADFDVGETIWVNSGVNWSDPAEPEFGRNMTIASISGTTITFTDAFGWTIRQWADADEIVALAGESERFKTGAWEARSGYYARGFGADHGLVRYAAGQPITNVTVENLTIARPRPGRTQTTFYAAHCFTTSYAKDITYRNCGAINPWGTAMFRINCDNLLVDTFAISGVGDSNNFDNVNFHAQAYALAQWGGYELTTKHVFIIGKGISLNNSERGSVDTLVRDVYQHNRPWFGPVQQIVSSNGVYGPQLRYRHEDMVFDVPVSSSSQFGSGLGSDILSIENFGYVGSSVPDIIPLSTIDATTSSVDGYITINDVRYGPMQSFSQGPIAVTGAGGVTNTLTPGLYKSLTITLSNTTGVSQVQAGNGNNLFSGSAVMTGLVAGGWGSVLAGPIATYLANRYVRMIGTGMDLTFTCTGEYMPVAA